MRVFDRVMAEKIKIAGVQCRVVDAVFAAAILVLAFWTRWALMPIESADYYGFLEGWMNTIRANGGFRSLGMEISNYASSYMYIMCLLSYITKNSLYALKLVSVLFDYAAAFAMFALVLYLTGSARKAFLGMTFLLFSPAVILDGAYWCQCDIIYAAFLLLALYSFFKKNSRRCMIFVGIAFSFKLQAVFILPFFLIMWAKRKTILLRHFLWIPAIYVISAVPAWLAGRDFMELMTIYFGQSSMYPWGTLAYPNMYALLGEAMPDMRHAAEVSGAGILLMIAILGGIAYYIYTSRVRLTKKLTVALALLTVGVVVYTLPHMHERYGILLDLLAILYVMMDVKKLPLYFGFSLVSVVSFMPYLIAVDILPLTYASIAMLGLLLYVGNDCRRMIEDGRAGRAKGRVGSEDSRAGNADN